ncbi:hypothetical protein PYCCODRAFT_1469688 [Trametes coccinea BRFM310]|uniref:Uncharacterized protein n=1 Tax=Trametes coccinea (strain BRFM310) TaxID=1353009 RepID=A0A1Y2IG92_TRAC3|nr:hypothetical protein PYCCODRAFT_1469688 [Trametes coccinea BRFM310]
MAAEFEIDPIFSTSLVFFSAAETHHASDLLWNRASVVVAEILPSIDGLAVQLSPECFACGPGFVTVATCVLNSPDIVMSCDESLRLVAWKSRDAVEWSRLRFSLRGEFLDFLWLFLDARHRLCNDTLDYQDQMNLLVQQYHALLLKVACPSICLAEVREGNPPPQAIRQYQCTCRPWCRDPLYVPGIEQILEDSMDLRRG